MKIAVLASHNGSNLEALLKASQEGRIESAIALVISNNPGSGALALAERWGVEARCVNRRRVEDVDAAIHDLLWGRSIDLVVLAGYMKRIGPKVLQAYGGRVLNTHPSLLPKYGGQGMYGIRVYEAVLEAGETETGVTVHVVDGEYDAGRILAQQRIPVPEGATPESLREAVQAMERLFLAETIYRIERGDILLAGGSADLNNNRLSQEG